MQRFDTLVTADLALLSGFIIQFCRVALQYFYRNWKGISSRMHLSVLHACTYCVLALWGTSWHTRAVHSSRKADTFMSHSQRSNAETVFSGVTFVLNVMQLNYNDSLMDVATCVDLTAGRCGRQTKLCCGYCHCRWITSTAAGTEHVSVVIWRCRDADWWSVNLYTYKHSCSGASPINQAAW